MPDKKGGSFIKLLLGTLVGSILGIFYAPSSEKKLRKDLNDDLENYLNKVKDAYSSIIDEAEKTAQEIRSKMEQLSALIDKYGEESLHDSIEKIELEINAIKNSVHAVVESYKNSKSNQMASGEIADDIFIDFVNENLEETNDETLPKKEGMHKRHDKKNH
jgi:gas vesicle protein